MKINKQKLYALAVAVKAIQGCDSKIKHIRISGTDIILSCDDPKMTLSDLRIPESESKQPPFQNTEGTALSFEAFGYQWQLY